MKIKKWLFIGIFLMIIGCIISGAAFASTGFEFEQLRLNQDYEIVETELDESVNEIKISSKIGNVKVESYEGEKVKIEYFEDKYFTCNFTIEEGLLNISYDYDGTFFNFDWWNFLEEYIKVYIPKTITLSECELNTTTGTIQVNNINAEYIKLKATTGDIKVNNSYSNKIVADCTTGKIQFTDIVVESDMIVESTTGDVILKNCTIEKLSVKCTTGSIRSTLLTCPNLDIKVTTGEIRLQIVGSKSEYNIDVSVKTGESNINDSYDSNNVKQMILKATTGDIKVTWK